MQFSIIIGGKNILQITFLKNETDLSKKCIIISCGYFMFSLTFKWHNGGNNKSMSSK